MYRRDRTGRRGGGVALYIANHLPAAIWTCPGDSEQYELLWMCVRVGNQDVYTGALYHPPKPTYQSSTFLDYVERCIERQTAESSDAYVLLAGDFNSLDGSALISRCALTPIVDKPTRGKNILDNIYVSQLAYENVKIVTSAVKSDHKAIVANSGTPPRDLNKTRERRVFRKATPTQNALFLEGASQLNIESKSDQDVQASFDQMYGVMASLLDQYYPKREITITSKDPRFITPAVKTLLRKKNRLMRAGRTNEADAVAHQVRKTISRQSTKWLRGVSTRKSAHDAWQKVRECLGRNTRQSEISIDGVTASVLNEHYAGISVDHEYQAPVVKQTVPEQKCFVTEYEVFRMLDRLKATAMGLDGIPSWFLRLGAPVFAAPLAQLYNQSITAGVVPTQWKAAIIKPVPKVSKPKKPSDYRPISITAVQSRMLERHVVRSYIYPALHRQVDGLYFGDQFGFRPTGSTTAALIAITHIVLTMLSSNAYVRVFALDFSKAFDTVRHATLVEKVTKLDMPDQVFNWIKDFFDGHTHCTAFAGEISSYASIQASVIQGSGLGPAAFLITAADLRPLHSENRIIKYADDTYLIVPACNTDTSCGELEHIREWANRNNLTLNRTKTKEILFRANVRLGGDIQLPAPCPDIERVDSLVVLGVVINDRLTATDHVSRLLESCSRLLYALRVLRDHGLPSSSMNDVFRSTVLAKILYCAPAWAGFCSAADREKLDAFLRRCKKLRYCDDNLPVIANLFDDADNQLFKRILANDKHILHHYMPQRTTANSQCLRPRKHYKHLIPKTRSLNGKDYIIRILYKDTY